MDDPEFFKNKKKSIGLPDYTISERKIASGKLEKSLRINRFILLYKKVIYNSM